MEVSDKVDKNQKQIEKEQEEYKELLNMWRDFPRIPTKEEINSALTRKEFKSNLQPIPPPDLDKEKQSLFESIQLDLRTKLPYSVLPGFLVKRKARKMADDGWSSRKAELLVCYDKVNEDYAVELAAEEAAWHEQEKVRVGRLKRLIDGDLIEIHTTAAEIIESINFPFDTACEIYLNDARDIFVHLDLPEIEDVIPTFQKKALKNGEIGEVGISQSGRNRDYFELVAGQALLLAAHLFGNLPTLRSVTIAGYTQRQRRRATDEIDTYLFDIAFPKAFIEGFDTNVDDLRPPLRSLSPVMSLRTNWELEKITRPGWLADQNETTSETENTS
jgi:hypothetical protein